MIQRTLLMGTILAIGTLYIFIERLNAGVSVEGARTAALTTMVFFQFFQAYNCRSETQSIFKMGFRSNPFLLFSIIAALFAQLAVLYVPAFQWIFRTEPISMTGWIEIMAVSLSIIIAVEIDKWLRRKKKGL
jgi:Ca2+-transporting ATPase